MSGNDSDSDVVDMEPTLQEVVDSKTLKWIFVGGKGGVGKTTTSCSLAIQLAKVRESVLLISTDPAHNLSDAFKQKIGSEPTQIKGVDNLFCMEIDSKSELNTFSQGMGSDALGPLKELVSTFPGIDEAISFGQLMKSVENMKYTTIIFDTAPTGHTLRLLSFPRLLDKGIGYLLKMKDKFGALFDQVSSSMGTNLNKGEIKQGIGSVRDTIRMVTKQFADPKLTTFVCVCIPEFLSLYETERLVQELDEYEIDVSNVVVNQVLMPEPNSDCKKCSARVGIQGKYLKQIDFLYDSYHVAKMPLLNEEVRGVDALKLFGHFLLSPYDPDKGYDEQMPEIKSVEAE